MLDDYPVRLDSDVPAAIYVNDFVLPIVERNAQPELFKVQAVARENFSFALASAIVEHSIRQIGIGVLNEIHFLDTYNIICNSTSLTFIKAGASSFMMDMDELLSVYDIEAGELEFIRKECTKLELTADNIRGTYEEEYSNWKNKMHHAVDINSNYLSFRTMASCQEFYDDMSVLFDIPRIELLIKYSPTDLVGNEVAFNEAVEEWRKLYTLVGLEVEYYDCLADLDILYERKGLKI